MVTITVNPSDVEEINAEIARIDARIRSLDESVAFFEKQLNGAPEVLLFTQEQINENPSLRDEQRVLFPAIVGVLQTDDTYKNLMFNQLQPIIDSYETERRALDGKFADFSPFLVFDETLIQNSGLNRTPPLFNPVVDANEPVNPGQMFGGTGSDPNNELAHLATEIAEETFLLSGT